MTTPTRPPRVALTARMWQILRRCYRGQQPTLVLAKALDMYANADGHLNPDGSLKQGRRP